METKEPLLRVRKLNVGFTSRAGYSPAVMDASFDIEKGKVTALVGESGSGKSVTALSILRLLPEQAVITADEINFEGTDLFRLSEKQMQKIRGNRISMIFQEPMTSLNPLMNISRQISESLILHQGMKPNEAKKQTIELLELVGIPDAKRRLNDFPHQLSGGMRQRVMIAMAMACKPEMLIADEATTALDVTIQAQILYLIKELQKKNDMTVLLITHNLGVVAETAQNVMVMYAGQIVENMSVEQTFTHPWHPYTHALIKSMPSAVEKGEKLYVIEGIVPDPLEYPPGCHFANRCPYADDECRLSAQELKEAEPNHFVRCCHPLSDERGIL